MYTVLGRFLFKRIKCIKLFKRMRSVLVVAEHNSEILNPITQQTITAAKKIGGDLTVLVAGHDCSTIAKSVSTVKGLKNVLVAEDTAFDGFLPENLTSLIVAIQKQYGFTHIMAGGTIFGKTLLPRVAAKLYVSPVTDVTYIEDFDTFARPIYDGNAIMTLITKDPVKVITIKPTHFEPCAIQENKRLHAKLAAVVRAMNLNKINPKDKYEFMKYQRLKQAADSLLKWQAIRAPIHQAPAGNYNLNLTKILKKEFVIIGKSKLEQATIVICGGKGMKSARNFEMLYELGRNINAAVGATKAAVDAEFASSDIQIGQDGKFVAPNVYIAVGVSGTAQHVAGMKHSKMIIAINKHPDAPIFKIANYGLIADLFKVIPELNSKLKSQTKSQNVLAMDNNPRGAEYYLKMFF